jgi:hypothetical protein
VADGKLTTADIIERLQARHPMFEGRWANIVEFQRIDFVAVGTWPSTKYVVHGYEIKTSRADWLRELKDPLKSIDGRAKVDFWWLAAPAGTVKEGELPDGWGLIEVNGRGTHIRVEAPRLRPPLPKKWVGGDLDPEWAARSAFAGMARRVAYAEADRMALMGLADIMDVEPALDGSAILTGRKTAYQREFRKARSSGKPRRKSPSRQRRKAQWEKSQETGW